MKKAIVIFTLLTLYSSCKDKCRNVVCAPCPACTTTMKFNFNLDSNDMGYSQQEIESIEIVKINRSNSERIDSVSFGFTSNSYESISSCSGGSYFGIGPNTFNEDDFFSFNYEIKPVIGNPISVKDIQYDWVFSGGCCDCGSIINFQASINDSIIIYPYFNTLSKK